MTTPRFLFALATLACMAGCAGTGALLAPERPAEVGIASYYASRFDGRATASGERYDQEALTAAHPSLPFGTRVRVTHLGNQRSVVVTINDRGPFRRGRVIDVSRRAARELGFLGHGTAHVRIEIVGR